MPQLWTPPYPVHTPPKVSVPLYYGFVEVVVLAAFSLWAWKSGWTYAPAAARDVLFPVGTATHTILEARRACILHVAQRILTHP